MPDLPPWRPYKSTTEAPLARFCRLMSAVKGEIIETTRADWTAVLRRVLADKGAQNLLYAPNTELGRAIDQAWAAEPGPRLVAYDKPIEELKAVLMNDIDAGITSTMGGIAETGSLIVWPSADEPRLMSLVPPIHIAVLDASTMFDSFPEAIDRRPRQALALRSCEWPAIR